MSLCPLLLLVLLLLSLVTDTANGFVTGGIGAAAIGVGVAV